jgi:hypothetical protein
MPTCRGRRLSTKSEGTRQGPFAFGYDRHGQVQLSNSTSHQPPATPPSGRGVQDGIAVTGELKARDSAARVLVPTSCHRTRCGEPGGPFRRGEGALLLAVRHERAT